MVRDLITGHFSVDRLDYLQRDSHHAGTPEYGIVDNRRILSSPLLHGLGQLSVYHRRAQYALEAAILSHFHMYRAVYFHPAVRAAYVSFQKVLWDAFGQRGPFAGANCWEDPRFWEEFDDYKCLSMLWSNDGLREGLESLFFRRNLPKMIHEDELVDDPSRSTVKAACEPFSRKLEVERKIVGDIRCKWPDLTICLLDSPTISSYLPIPYAEKSIYVWDPERTPGPELFERKAAYVARLSEAYEVARVYVNPV